MNKKDIFKKAWKTAKDAAAKFQTGNARSYFAESLRLAWAEAKTLLKQAAEKTFRIPGWFAAKKRIDPLFRESQIKRMTEKAVLVQGISLSRGKPDIRDTGVWIPKSILLQ